MFVVGDVCLDVGWFLVCFEFVNLNLGLVIVV